MRVALTDDAWAELGDPKKVKQRYRRPILEAMRSFGNPEPKDGETIEEATKRAVTAAGVAPLLDFTELGMVALVEAWSFSIPLPRDDHSSIEELIGDDYDLLSSAVSGLIKEMFTSFTPNPSPDSPTSPSNA